MLLALILQVVAQPAAFVDVSVIPIARLGVIPHQTVIVRNDRIAWIGPAAKAVVPADAVLIDGRGQYLLPGFADMHTHPGSPFDLYTYLANGITRIRVMWGDTATLRWRRRRHAAGPSHRDGRRDHRRQSALPAIDEGADRPRFGPR